MGRGDWFFARGYSAPPPPRGPAVSCLRHRQEVLAGIDELVGLEVVLLVVELPVAAVLARAARACVPRSTISPPSMTRIWSAPRMVERRWAMTKVVRPRRRARRPSWIFASLSLSRLEVASSRMRMAGSARMARAMAMRWRWPPESLMPRSPMIGVVLLLERLDELVDVGDARGLAASRSIVASGLP